MKPLNQLSIGTLTAFKRALDGYQRYEKTDPDVSHAFFRIMDALAGPITDLNVWAIRELINQEEDRRSRQVVVKSAKPNLYNELSKLGPQELRILKLVGEGNKSEDIADLLSISNRTVANHKAHIVQKLGLGSTRELTKFAIDNLTFI